MSHSKDIVNMVFDYAELGALQFFWSLKRGTRTFHFRYNEPSYEILGPLGRCDDPWEKKQNTRTRDLSSGKKYEIPHFCR